MNDLDLDVFGDACEKAAGLIRQRRAGEQVAFQLSAALGEIGVRFQFARGLLNADQHAREPQPVGVGDKAPKAALLAGLMHELQPYRGKKARAAEEDVERVLPQLVRLADKLVATAQEMAEVLRGGPAPAPASKLAAATNGSTPRPPRREAAQPNGHLDLKGGKGRMLAALAAFYPGAMTKAQVAAAGDMKPSGGAFSAAWAELRRGDLIVEAGSDMWRASKLGCTLAGISPAEMPRTLEARIAFWMERLSGTEQKMLRCIADQSHHVGLSRDQLADMVGMTVTGGAFSSAVGTLTRNNLVAKKGTKLLLSSWLVDGPEASAHA